MSDLLVVSRFQNQIKPFRITIALNKPAAYKTIIEWELLSAIRIGDFDLSSKAF